MSVKLSELLEEAAGALLSCASFCEEYGNKQGQREAEQGSTLLCAIAPALVAIAKDAAHFKTLHGPFWAAHQQCPTCQLVAALEKAGVTCD